VRRCYEGEGNGVTLRTCFLPRPPLGHKQQIFSRPDQHIALCHQMSPLSLIAAEQRTLEEAGLARRRASGVSPRRHSVRKVYPHTR
jgi:hypothetical protein